MLLYCLNFYSMHPQCANCAVNFATTLLTAVARGCWETQWDNCKAQLQPAGGTSQQRSGAAWGSVTGRGNSGATETASAGELLINSVLTKYFCPFFWWTWFDFVSRYFLRQVLSFCALKTMLAVMSSAFFHNINTATAHLALTSLRRKLPQRGRASLDSSRSIVFKATATRRMQRCQSSELSWTKNDRMRFVYLLNSHERLRNTDVHFPCWRKRGKEGRRKGRKGGPSCETSSSS